MINRLLSRKSLLILGAVSAVLYASLGILMYMMDLTVSNIVVYVLLGITMVIGLLFFGREETRIRFEWKQALLISFLVWLLITCIVRTIIHQADYVDFHSTVLLDTSVLVFLVFPLGYVLAREEKVPKCLKIIPHLVLLGWSIFMLVVLITIFQGKVIYTANGGMIGMEKYQFLYLNCYYNTTGMWEVVFVPACFYMLLKSKPIRMKPVYGLACLINFAILTLSNSRTATYSVMIGLMAMCGIGVYSFLKQKKEMQRILFGVAAGIGMLLMTYLLRKGVFELYWHVARSFAGNGALQITGEIRNLSDSTVSTFTGRTEIWKYSIQGIFNSVQNAVFGVSPAGVIPTITEISDGIWEDVYTHNQFLEIGLANGVVGMGIFIAWFALVVRDIWRMVFVRKEKTVLLCIPVMILTLALANFFEATLVYYRFISSYAFFFLCGILHGKTNSPVPVQAGNRHQWRRNNC